MNWNYRKPIFTNVSDLISINTAMPSINISWTFPTNFNDPINTHNNNNVISYDIYRHIEIKLANTSNGGVNNNPTLNNFQKHFRYVKTVDKTATSFDDPLDLSVHYDEGIIKLADKWVDLDRRDVIEEIKTSKRRIYYKIIANMSTVNFNSLPFIYIAHTDGVECRSIVTQVYDNTLYYEGDIVWFNNNELGPINRIAVDTTYDSQKNRFRNVWAAGTDKVFCLNGSTGEKILHTITVSGLGIISALRIDPDTGDAIFIGNTSSVNRVSVLTGNITIINTVPTLTNNNGLIIAKENNSHFVYTINNYDTISKIGLDSNSKITYPRTQFGCSSSTIANIPNVLGITNGADGGVWVNGHTPIHYKYMYNAQSCKTDYAWHGVCDSNGVIKESEATAWNNYHRSAINDGRLGYAACTQAKHYVGTTTCNTINISNDTNFLQDIGYIYGVTTNINNSATNGQLYPYPPSSINVHYSPFTSSTGRGGWVGSSPTSDSRYDGPNSGRPFLGQPTTPIAKDNPNPAKSQKGIACTYPNLGLLSSNNNYDIYQVNEIENKIHKLSWNRTNSVNGLTYNTTTPIASTDYWNVANPTHVSVDTQNNIWVIQEMGTTPSSELTLIYNLENTTNFASGGMCVYPTIQSSADYITDNYIYGANGNNPYIEYYLTRNTTFTSGMTAKHTGGQYLSNYGVTLSGNIANKIETAIAWCTTGANYLSNGIRVYPNYTGLHKTATFARTINTDTTEYNSDNIGTMMLFSTQSVESPSDFIHPKISYPQLKLNVINPLSVSVNCDGTFWNDLNTQNTLFTKVSGYDDLKIMLSATTITNGSFDPTGYTFIYDDKIKDIYGHINITNTTTQDNTITYTYNDPSINGKPFHRTTLSAEFDGKFTPYSKLNFEPSCYTLSGELIISSVDSNTVDVTVFERWPTAKFYVNPYDTATIRNTYLSSWNLGTESVFPVSNNGLPKADEKRIVYGYDPLSAQFNDLSITRTWPISTWFWTYGDKMTYLGFPISNGNMTNYAHVTSSNLYGTLLLNNADDCTREVKNVTEHLYKGPGIYYATLWVQASVSTTSSWNISSGVTNETTMNNKFVSATVRQINVLEVCPTIKTMVDGIPTLFKTISAQTTTPQFSADANVYNNIVGAYISTDIISGYAPYLKVTLETFISGASLPISATHWDFGDYYTNPLASDYTRYNSPTVGWPIWNTGGYYTSAVHTYVMPGFYDITLQAITSSIEGLPNTCNTEYTSKNSKHMAIYVEEIPLQCNVTLLSSSNISPVTVTINPSATKTGSFPICRIDYDFGDGSDILTISRIMSSEYVKYTNTGKYSDISDPRNIIVTHDYTRTNNTQSNMFTISTVAYACNTNSYDVNTLTIGPVELQSFGDVVGNVHLLENRMFHTDNDVLLVFEGDKSLNSYTLLLSTGNI